VFSGIKGGYTEDDLTDAEDLYGRSKALGEVTDSHAITLRTSIIGRELGSQLGLVEWFLAESGCVRGFSEAYFSGFTTLELAKIIERTILDHRDLSGLYQVSAERIDKCSLLELLRDAFGHNIEIVRDGTVKIDRSLKSARFKTATGYEPPGWEEMISAMTADPTRYGKRVGT
jgi:dTDP-4-dehydrorhamnose reductase